MIEDLKRMLSNIEEAIGYAEETDLADTSYYAKLCKQRKILKRTIRQISRTQRGACNV